MTARQQRKTFNLKVEPRAFRVDGRALNRFEAPAAKVRQRNGLDAGVDPHGAAWRAVHGQAWVSFCALNRLGDQEGPESNSLAIALQQVSFVSEVCRARVEDLERSESQYLHILYWAPIGRVDEVLYSPRKSHMITLMASGRR